MPHLLKSLFIFLFISFINPVFGQTENIAEISVPEINNAIHCGDTLFIPVKITLQKGWHINSDKPEEDFLIATKLYISAGKDSIPFKITYPKPQQIKSGFSEKPLMVFNSGSIIQCMAVIPGSCNITKLNLIFELEYQACSNKTCSPPETARLEKEYSIETK